MSNAFSYAIIRVVPRVEREEFINVGVVLYCQKLQKLCARVVLDESRLLAVFPGVSLDDVRVHLDAFVAIAHGDVRGGPIAKLSLTERFHWLAATRSTMIQTSPAHAGVCDDANAMIDKLMQQYVG